MRIAAPGPQVSAGRLRVDAARAIRKLREYQLADRATWVLEAIRAAVASGATAIELRGDANDIWLAWHGAPWDAELLPRLFDELVSPEATDDRQHVRLLAAAINSALGMNPAYVDVYAITAAGQARRARYTPDVLAEPENELGEAALRHVELEAAEPPTAVMSGMLVHLRRRVGLDVVSYWLGEPPELPIARANCRDIAVPLTVNDEQPLHRKMHRDLLQIPLDEGLSGFVAVTDDLAVPGRTLEVAERGVVLVRYAFDVIGHGPQMRLPLRVFVDADRLPTNVSRSQVRRDIHPIATAERRAVQLGGRVLNELATLCTDASADIAQRARQAAAWLLASAIGGHPSIWHSVPEVFAPLSALPLVRNAFGEPRTIRARFEPFIYTEKLPLDATLKPWLGEILWIPPVDPSLSLLGGTTVDVGAMRRRVRWARQQKRAHEKFLAHKKRALTVTTSTPARARIGLGAPLAGSCVPQSIFDGMTGEICVYDSAANASVVLCIDERELERIELTTPIGFDAVVDCKQLVPDDRYRGVRRDEAYERVIGALRAGVVRAVETIAAQRAAGDGDRALVRRALLLAHSLELPLGGPLVAAPAWTTVGGEHVSYATLATSGAFGVVGERDEIVPPAGRLIVRIGAGELERLRTMFTQPIVPYFRAVTAPALDLERLASKLASFDRAASLTFSTREFVGVIALSGKPTLHLHHRGVALAEVPYTSELVSCAIALDSDAIVPNERWSGIVDDAGLPKRSYRDLETAVVRAIVATLVGKRPAELVTPARIEGLADANLLALTQVFATQNASELLGRELYAALLDAPLVTELGSADPVSIADVMERQPQGIHFVATQSDRVDDLCPIVASERVATLVGAIARLPVFEGTHELERRRRLLAGRKRLEVHRKQREEALAVPGSFPSVPLTGRVRGLLSVSTEVPAIHLFVDSRPWLVIRPELVAPLVAAVELPVGQCGDAFDSVPNLVLEEILEAMRDTVPRLLAEIANHAPRLLGQPGPARRLLASNLSGSRVDAELHDLLRSVPAFETIQGEYVSIARAEDQSLHLAVAAYHDDWHGPVEGETTTSLEGPVLRVTRPPDELSTIIGRLHMGAVSDVTNDVLRLQARRRMARGLMPTPKLAAVPPILKRALPAFGELTKQLGHGEVGFAPAGGPSQLVIFEQGQQTRTVQVDVLPAIHLAVESPDDIFDAERMRGMAQMLAVELVRTLLPAIGASAPAEVRKSVGKAVLARRVPPILVNTIPVFECLDGSWLDWRGFQEQHEKFGDVWAVTGSPRNREPLDPARRVLALDTSEMEIATTSGQPIINAAIELELDLTARTNMARRPVDELRVPGYDGVLAEFELAGDGETSPRGTVAVLAPASAGRRGLYPHRALHPFDLVEDPCRWPTLAVIDDARITPDRTWSAPKADGTWQSIVKEVRAASERALELVGEVPSGALVSVRVTNELCSGVSALRAAPRSLFRGVLWLTELPYTPVTIAVRGSTGVRPVTAPHGIALGGSLALYMVDELDLDDALDELCRVAYGRIVRKLVQEDTADADLIAAHVAHALALRAVKPTEISGVKFTCFAPRPLEARALMALFDRKTSIPQVSVFRTDINEPAFHDNGSELAKVVRVHFGDRLLRYTPRAEPAPPRPTAPARPPVSMERPAPAPKPPPKPREPHVLEPLVGALTRRISQLGVSPGNITISTSIDRMLWCDGEELFVGGENRRLLELAGMHASASPFALAAIDVLAAHAVSLLNIARTDITDATEQSALSVLLASPLSAGPRQSRRSS